MTNIENNNEFYKFSHAITDKQIVKFNGKNPCLLYGKGIPVFVDAGIPILIDDIAYEKDGKLYQIITNQEVKVIHEGINEREENQIFAAANIEKATAEDLKNFVLIMTYKRNKNISSYKYTYKKSK